MSLWTDLVVYSDRMPTRDGALCICRHLGVTAIPYIEILIDQYQDEDNLEILVEDHSIDDSLTSLYQLDNFCMASLPIKCVAYVERMTSVLRESLPHTQFSFLGAAIEIGTHEFGGFSASIRPGNMEEHRFANFSLSLGGDDPDAEFRDVWAAVQKSKIYTELINAIQNCVGPVQADMYLST